MRRYSGAYSKVDFSCEIRFGIYESYTCFETNMWSKRDMGNSTYTYMSINTWISYWGIIVLKKSLLLSIKAVRNSLFMRAITLCRQRRFSKNLACNYHSCYDKKKNMENVSSQLMLSLTSILMISNVLYCVYFLENGYKKFKFTIIISSLLLVLCELFNIYLLSSSS